MMARLAVLNHVLDILQYPQEVKDVIQLDASIKSVVLFTNIESDRLLALEGVKHGHMKSLELFKEWFQDYVMMNGGTPDDWFIEFTENVWEEFMIGQALKKFTAKSAAIPSAPMPALVPSSAAPVKSVTTSVSLP